MCTGICLGDVPIIQNEEYLTAAWLMKNDQKKKKKKKLQVEKKYADDFLESIRVVKRFTCFN